MPDAESIALRKTVIGGQTYADDFTVIWRIASQPGDPTARDGWHDLPIGRIMKASGIPASFTQAGAELFA
jgi:hypothetical protein